MSTYRRMAARFDNANWNSRGKLDQRLTKLDEHIGELLRQLTDAERSALDCWTEGIMPNTYRVDHAALKQKPYISNRRVERFTEERCSSDDAEPDSEPVEDPEARQRLMALVKRSNR